MRTRKRTLREKIEKFEVSLGLFENGGWYTGYRTPCGKLLDALECYDSPHDVVDLLDSYGIHGVSWTYLGNTYVYW